MSWGQGITFFVRGNLHFCGVVLLVWLVGFCYGIRMIFKQIYSQSGSGSNGNERSLHTSHISWADASPLDAVWTPFLWRSLKEIQCQYILSSSCFLMQYQKEKKIKSSNIRIIMTIEDTDPKYHWPYSQQGCKSHPAQKKGCAVYDTKLHLTVKF